MSVKVLQLNALLGMTSTAAASALLALMLTNPAKLATEVAQREYGAIALAVAQQLAGWLHAVLRFL